MDQCHAGCADLRGPPTTPPAGRTRLLRFAGRRREGSSSSACAALRPLRIVLLLLLVQRAARTRPAITGTGPERNAEISLPDLLGKRALDEKVGWRGTRNDCCSGIWYELGRAVLS